MSPRRIKALVKKEFIQMRRDIRSLMGAIFIPLLMIFLFGYALSLDVDRIPTAVFDQDETPTSRQFIHLMTDSRYFKVVRYLSRESEVEESLGRGEALMVLVVPGDFSSNVKRGMQAPVQATFDGSDSNTATIAMGYLKAVTSGFDMRLQAQRLRRAGISLLPNDVAASHDLTLRVVLVALRVKAAYVAHPDDTDLQSHCLPNLLRFTELGTRAVYGRGMDLSTGRS